MSQRTWTREELEALKGLRIVQIAKHLGLKAGGKKVVLIGRILEFQQSNLADAVPLPEPSPEPPQVSRPSHHALSVYEDPGKMVISPQKAASPGSNPSHDSASGRYPSLRTNTSPRKDKGKAIEVVDAEQLKGATGEFSSPHINISHQLASTMATPWKRARRRPKPTRPPHGGESSLPQNPEPNQNNDSQEGFQVQQNDLISDNNVIESRLKKLETSVSELQEKNARIIKHNNELRSKNADIREENADLKIQMSTFNSRLVKLEGLLNGEALARSSSASLADLEGESAPSPGSPQPIKTPQPDTTPKAPPRHLEGLEVASTNENTAARDSSAPLSLLPLPPPNRNPGPVEIRPTSRSSSQTLSGSHESQPLSTPGDSHFSGNNRKRKLEEPEPGSSVALDACVPFKRTKPNSSPEELVEDPASLQRERRGGEAVRGAFTTPPNPPPVNPPPTHALISCPDCSFNQGSPSPQQRRPPPTPATQDLRHGVPSPGRRPEAQSSGTQLITPLVGEAIPGAPVQVVAVPVRGHDARHTPEPTSSRACPNHMVGLSALASAVGEGFNPPSSSTPTRPGPSSLVMRTSLVTSQPATGASPYEHLPLNATPTPPPAISARPSTASGGSRSSGGTNSDRAEGENQVPAPAPVEKETESVRVGRGLPELTGAQLSSALDPLRFTGAIRKLRGQANPPTPTTPDSSMRQVAPETPMATPTRYGTEINPSLRHLYWYGL